jgi:modulator of FtsH protease
MHYRPEGYEYGSHAELAYGPSKVALLKKVYGLLTASIVCSAIGAMVALYAGASASQISYQGVVIPPLVFFFMKYWWVGLILMLGSVFGASALRQRPGINVVALFGMATIMGVVIAPSIFIAQLGVRAGTAITAAPVRDSFILAFAGFSGLSCYALVSKKDFSYLGGALTMGLFVLIGASLLSFFVGGWHFHMAIASVSVLLFGGYVLYDTSRLLRVGERDPVGMTISLYFDFVNLFLALLRIFGGGRRN